jgi:hypothetical protein
VRKIYNFACITGQQLEDTKAQKQEKERNVGILHVISNLLNAVYQQWHDLSQLR